MIIDVHTHLAFHEIFAKGFLSEIQHELRSAGLSDTLMNFLLNDQQGKKMIKEMDKAGISKAVLLIADFGMALGEAALTLEEIHLLHYEVIKTYPNRFLAFAGADPRRGDEGLRIVDNAINNWGFHGLKLYPPCGFELDDPALYDYYEICAARSLPILTHTGPSLRTLKTEKRYPETIRKIARQFKNCTIILGHGAVVNPQLNIELAKEFNNVFLDISTFQKVVSGMEEWEYRLKELFDVVPDKILFGTDWPMFRMSVTQKELVDRCLNAKTLSSENISKLMHKNAEIALNLI